MSRIHLRSNTLVLWLSLSAVVAAAAVSGGCSSSSDSGGDTGGTSSAGKANGGAGKAGAGEDDTAGDTGTGEGGAGDMPSVGGGGTGGGDETVAGAAGEGGTTDVPSTGGGGATGGTGGSGPAADPDIQAGLDLTNSLSPSRRCTFCHQSNYAGSGFWANITPDPDFGIGTWTKQEIATAITMGKDADGKTLCNTMERYEFTNDEALKIATFLKSVTPNKKNITAVCANP